MKVVRDCGKGAGDDVKDARDGVKGGRDGVNGAGKGAGDGVQFPSYHLLPLLDHI